MTTLFRTLLLSAFLTMAAQAQTVVGDWEGTLKVGQAELRLALHVTGDEKKGLKATLDSIDQNAMNVPVTSIALAGSTLTFSIEPIGGTYEGKVSGDSSSISGTWAQGGGSLPLEFKRAAPRAEAKKRVPKPSDVDGDWEGAIDAGGQTLRVVLHILTYEDGMTATLDSPDQNLTGLPVTTVTRDGATLKFEMRQLAAGYAGKIDPELKTIGGTWEQGGASLPLTWKRKGAAPGK